MRGRHVDDRVFLPVEFGVECCPVAGLSEAERVERPLVLLAPLLDGQGRVSAQSDHPLPIVVARE